MMRVAVTTTTSNQNCKANFRRSFAETWKTRFVFCHVLIHVIAPDPVSLKPGPRKTRKKADDKSAHRRRRNNLKPADPKNCQRNLGARIVLACAHAAPSKQTKNFAMKDEKLEFAIFGSCIASFR
jgi:hypothetical protein